MDPQTVQEMLDSLDMQLAAGKIDLDTYNRLSAKWQAKLQDNSRYQGEGVSSSLGTDQPNVTQIACPECSAPLDDLQAEPGSLVRCSYCRATFSLQRAQEQTEQSSTELRAWLQQMVVESGETGSVDAASRRYIFNEKLYPALQLEYRRGMEPYEDAFEHPFVYLELLERLDGYRAAQHVLTYNPSAIPTVRALSLKVNSPLVGGFAVVEEDSRKLRDLDLGTTSLVHLANVAKLLVQPSPEAYASAKENILALSEEYSNYLNMPLEPGYKEYVQAIRARIEAAARVFDVLATVTAQGADFAPQVFLEELEGAGRELQHAQELADASSHSPLAVLPLRTGIERDQKSLRLIEALLNSYHTASGSRPLTFSSYYADLKALLSLIKPRFTDPDQLVSSIGQIDAILMAHRGQESLHRVERWDWCEKQVNAGRYRSLFASESVSSQQHYWHPFWCATIHYASSKGRVFVSGVEQTGFGLIDAVSKPTRPTIILEGRRLHDEVGQALGQRLGGDGKAILPSIMSSAAAQQAIYRAVGAIQDMRSAKVADMDLIYLPAVVVEYEDKSGTRKAVYVWEQLQDENLDIPSLLSAVGPFFERYK